MRRMFLLGGMLICLLSACGFRDEGAESISGGSEESMVSSQTETPPPVFSEAQKKHLEAILLGDEDFIHCSGDGEEQEPMKIGGIRRAFTDSEEVTGRVSKFAVVDMDGDGESEVVLWIETQSLDEGFEILHWQEGEVYGYHFWFRAIEELKEDGTFISSSGASDMQIEWLFFPEKGYIKDILYQRESYYSSDGEMETRYCANGEMCSEEEFNAALERHNAKTDVLWYELTPENIELAFNTADTETAQEVSTAAGAQEPGWAQGIQIDGELFQGLNLDGIGDADDEVYVSVYQFGDYDEDKLTVLRVHLGTGETMAEVFPYCGFIEVKTGKLFSADKDAIVLEIRDFTSNYGAAEVFALEVSPAGADPIPGCAVRLDTLNPQNNRFIDEAILESLHGYTVGGAEIVDVEGQPLQGLVIPVFDYGETKVLYWEDWEWHLVQ